MEESTTAREPLVGSIVGPIRARPLLVAVAAWLGMVALAIANATLREVFITPTVGEYVAHVLSTVTLLVVLAVVVGLYFDRRPAHRNAELVAIGLLWSGLTVAFELLFGHYVAGESWATLFGLYNVLAGRVWVFVPLFLLVAPWVVGRWLRR